MRNFTGYLLLASKPGGFTKKPCTLAFAAPVNQNDSSGDIATCDSTDWLMWVNCVFVTSLLPFSCTAKTSLGIAIVIPLTQIVRPSWETCGESRNPSTTFCTGPPLTFTLYSGASPWHSEVKYRRDESGAHANAPTH